MLGYYKTALKRASLSFPIMRLFSITILLSLFLTPPRQTFPAPYAPVTDQRYGTIPDRVAVINLTKKIVVETIDVGTNPKV